MNYDVIIGLEIHAELLTKSKMFCACDNDATDKAPNTTVCPICLAHPGTLPQPNKRAIELVILAGLATDCEISTYSKFDRKNYFYPDLPKGYQISQYDQPLCRNGHLETASGAVAITRIHLEEDTGKSSHPTDKDYSLLDFNRAGTPLLELVSEPVIRSAAQAKDFCQRFQQLLRYLKISQADMEKGQMRCEANISLQEPGTWEYQDGAIISLTKKKKLNPKVEVKNINSFKAVEKAINYEIERQEKLLAKGETIKAETRGWDDKKNQTKSQRLKESAADYRYFPEPDIPPLEISPEWIKKIAQEIGELPEEKINRFTKQYGWRRDQAELIAADEDLSDFTEQAISEAEAWLVAHQDSSHRADKKLAGVVINWVSSELLKFLRADNKKVVELLITPENFGQLVCLIQQGKVNSSIGQKILEKMYQQGGDPIQIMTDLGLEQVDDEVLIKETITKVLNDYPEQAADYKNGKTTLLQFFIGKVMAETRGRANPEKVKALLEK